MIKYPRTVVAVVVTVANFVVAGSSCFITCVYQEAIRRSFRAVGKVVRSAGKFKDETDVSNVPLNSRMTINANKFKLEPFFQ